MKREHDVKWEQEGCSVEVTRRQGENWWVTQSKGMCSLYTLCICSEYNCKDSKSVHDEHSSNICYWFCPIVNQSIYSTTCVLFLFFPFTICFHPKSSQKCQWCGPPISQFTLSRVRISKWPQVQFWHSEAMQCSFLLLSFGIVSLKSPILLKSNKTAQCWFESFVSCLSQMVN